MSEAEYGFVFPKIDVAKCIDCGLCDRICPEITMPALSMPRTVYAGYCNDKAELASCASGGAATVMSRDVIHRGGVVYGCSQKDYRTIRHIGVEREEDLSLLKGSKYVQSDMSGIYQSVKDDLSGGREVLFVGTPCQVAALYGYLRRPYDNLTTIDLICHGVPSQAMLRETVESAKKQCDVLADEIFVNFRWKTQYGIQYGIQFGNNNRIWKSAPAGNSAYMMAFLSGLSYRENCHRCRYSCRERVGDITIGDFWGLGQQTPSAIDPSQGVSLVLVNTSRGEAMWQAVRDKFFFEERTIDEAVKYNWNLHDPSPRPAVKDKFLGIYFAQGMDAAVRACNSRYRMEQTALVRFVRRVPLLDKSFGATMRAIRKLLQKNISI